MIIKGIIGYVCRWHYDSPSSASFYISTEASVAPGFYFLNLDPEDDEQKDQTMRELKILPRQAEMWVSDGRIHDGKLRLVVGTLLPSIVSGLGHFMAIQFHPWRLKTAFSCPMIVYAIHFMFHAYPIVMSASKKLSTRFWWPGVLLSPHLLSLHGNDFLYASIGSSFSRLLCIAFSFNLYFVSFMS